eukprot:GILI01000954.1.p1 GENE.GILI01000954.1~~GILI01000954.1.p1  ORF type:complete len:493 (-),score=104.06 GILI01000954.1:184-1467(-)
MVSKENKRVAVKKISRDTVTPLQARRILRELKIMSHLATQKHKIKHLLDVRDLSFVRSDDPTKVPFDDIYVVTPLMEADLSRVIMNQLTERHVQYLMYQMLVGVWHLHACNIIHRDLKPGNLLVNSACDLRVCDFGLSRSLSTHAKKPGQRWEPLTEYVVTRWYRAPEVLLESKGYGKPVDIWSAGCILAELFLRRPLFPGNDYIDQLKRIFALSGNPDEEVLRNIHNDVAVNWVRQNFPAEKSSSSKTSLKDKMMHAMFRRSSKSAESEQSSLYAHRMHALFEKDGVHISDSAFDFLMRMLDINPATRATVEECLTHPFLSSYFDEKDVAHAPSPIDMSYEQMFSNAEQDLPLIRDMIADEIRRFKVAKTSRERGGLITKGPVSLLSDSEPNTPASLCGSPTSPAQYEEPESFLSPTPSSPFVSSF